MMLPEDTRATSAPDSVDVTMPVKTVPQVAPELLMTEKVPCVVSPTTDETAVARPPRPVVPPNAPHVNYAWRSLDRVKYERLGSDFAGGPISVAPPNALAPVEIVDPELVIRTRAFDGAPRAIYGICAHFKYNDACDLGVDCRFVHLVSLDPEARPYQKAGTKDKAALARCLSVPFDEALGELHQTPLPPPPGKQTSDMSATARAQAAARNHHQMRTGAMQPHPPSLFRQALPPPPGYVYGMQQQQQQQQQLPPASYHAMPPASSVGGGYTLVSMQPPQPQQQLQPQHTGLAYQAPQQSFGTPMLVPHQHQYQHHAMAMQQPHQQFVALPVPQQPQQVLPPGYTFAPSQPHSQPPQPPQHVQLMPHQSYLPYAAAQQHQHQHFVQFAGDGTQWAFVQQQQQQQAPPNVVLMSAPPQAYHQNHHYPSGSM